MSGLYSVSNQISELRKWVGYHEGNNNVQPFTAWQFDNHLTNLAWCDSFAQWCAVAAGGFQWPNYCQCGHKGDAYVPGSHTHAANMGIWRSPQTWARPGWQCIFDWGDGQDDHIETVVGPDTGGTFLTIGGNTSDMVAYRQRNRAYLVGFIALDEAGQNVPAPAPRPPAPAPPPPPPPPPSPVAPEGPDMLFKPGSPANAVKPVVIQAINGAIFAFETATNPIHEGTLAPFGNGHVVINLPNFAPGERVMALTDKQPDGSPCAPGSFIAMGLRTDGIMQRHDLHWA